MGRDRRRVGGRLAWTGVTLLSVLAIAWPAPLSASRGNEPVDLVREESKHLYMPVPDIDVELIDGRHVRLADLWRDTPLLVTLFYSHCAGTCTPFLRSLHTAVEQNGGLGSEYRVLSLSFDPHDTLENARATAAAVGVESGGAWLFGTSTPADVARLAEAVGFWYEPVQATNQFDHPSLVAAVRDGTVVRVLLGTTVNASRLKSALFELKGVYVPLYSRPGENVLFRCLQIDALTQEVRFDWGMLLLVVPGLLALAIGGTIFRTTGRPTSREA